jgi:hypothetical protein
MFKRRRVREHASNRARIFARIFDEFSLVNGLELELIEAGRESRLLVFGYPEA